MIFPWLKGFVHLEKIPFTLAILCANIFIFLMTLEPPADVRQQVNLKPETMYMTAQLYYQYRGGKGLAPADELVPLSAQALKDVGFISGLKDFQFSGDQIEINEWKKTMQTYRDVLGNRMSAIFGLRYEQSQPLTWVTYQFMHSGVIHLLSNMMFLWVFASAIEVSLGGLYVLAIYLLGGLAAAVGFYF